MTFIVLPVNTLIGFYHCKKHESGQIVRTGIIMQTFPRIRLHLVVVVRVVKSANGTSADLDDNNLRVLHNQNSHLPIVTNLVV